MQEEQASDTDEYDKLWSEMSGEAVEPEEGETAEDPVEEATEEPEEAQSEAPEAAEEAADAKELADLEHKRRSEAGRAAAYAKRAQAIEQEIARLKARKKPDPDAEESDRLSAVKDEYGDIVAPLVEGLTELRQEREQELQDREDSLQAEMESIEKEQTAIFQSVHPDGFDVVGKYGSAFVDWVEDQPKKYRDAFAVNKDRIVDGEAAAELISHFKRSIEPPQQTEKEQLKPKLGDRRRRQLDGARTMPQKAHGATPVDPGPSEDYDKEWDYWERKNAR